jgi:hypothetical protein
VDRTVIFDLVVRRVNANGVFEPGGLIEWQLRQDTYAKEILTINGGLIMLKGM